MTDVDVGAVITGGAVVGRDWMARAACRPEPSWTHEQRKAHTALFFPERGESHAKGKAFCAKCPVRSECGQYAKEIETDHGIWGGKTHSRGNWNHPETDQPEQEQKYVIPKRLSATSINTYLACPARWRAEYIQGAKMPSGDAASLGTVCHECYEVWVKDGWYLKDMDILIQKSTMKGIFDEVYWRHFGDAERYEEGLGLVQTWVERQNWEGRTVVSTEERVVFQIPTSAGPIDFMYVIDRLDKLDSGTFEIVDYKSFVRPVQPGELKSKPQCRIYALGVQLANPHVDGVWMTFDLLRYEPVSVYFSKDENRATWVWLCALAERIVQDDTAQEKLNDDCRYCVRRHECDTLLKHSSVGGPLGITDVNLAAIRFFEIDKALKGLQVAKEDLERVLLQHMEVNQEVEMNIQGLTVAVTVSSRRDVNTDRVRAIVGEEIMAKYGTMSITKLDALLKSSDIDADTKFELRRLIQQKYGDPKIKITMPIEQVA